MRKISGHITSWACAFATLAMMQAAWAEGTDYPTKPVTVIVDRAPGGGTDITARLMAQYLTKALGQQFIVENQPGAAGRIALQRLSGSAADGYTLLVVGSSYTVNPALYKLEIDPVEDITPVVAISEGGLLLVASPKLAAKTLPDLLKQAKANPRKITSATVGSGSISDLSTALLEMMAGAQFTHVEYKGAGPAMNDTMAGVTDILFSSPANAVPQVKASTLTALATTADVPMPGMTEVPTMQSAGVPGYKVLEWYGVIGPKGVPAPIVEKLNGAVNRDGFVPAGGSAADFKARIATGIEQWSKVVQGMNIKPE
jgi:tripartite-type tricarboxylate transporter receptor subunit TctC